MTDDPSGADAALQQYRQLGVAVGSTLDLDAGMVDITGAIRYALLRESVARVLDLEAGLVGSYGRTLATTGTAAASVDVSAEDALAVGRRVLERVAQQLSAEAGANGQADDHRTEVWVRGVLERLRADGAIAH